VLDAFDMSPLLVLARCPVGLERRRYGRRHGGASPALTNRTLRGVVISDHADGSHEVVRGRGGSEAVLGDPSAQIGDTPADGAVVRVVADAAAVAHGVRVLPGSHERLELGAQGV
jgi:hypothetical protein